MQQHPCSSGLNTQQGLQDQATCSHPLASIRVQPQAPTPPALPSKSHLLHRQAGLLCSADDFWFINLCEALGEHFACEAGCTVESGYDVPCYVARPDHTMHGACLVSQQQPRCEAHHNATRRLCPCVSPPGEEAAPLPAA